MQMANVRWSMRLSIVVLLIIFQTTIAQSHTIHRRQNIFESADSIDKASLSVSNETVPAISTENEPPSILDENDGGGIDDVMIQPSRTKNADIQNVNELNNNVNNNNNNNEVVKVSSTTDINNVIEQSFGARNNDTNARAAATVVTIATPAGIGVSSTLNAPTNFTKDFSHDESVENR